ncbi:hypothetical protein E4U23_000451, partial [Claviceps purpurea]
MAMEGKLYKSKSDTTKSRRSKKDTKSSSRRRRHGHSVACESDSTDTESTSEDSDSDDDSDKTERVMLSKENIQAGEFDGKIMEKKSDDRPVRAVPANEDVTDDKSGAEATKEKMYRDTSSIID